MKLPISPKAGFQGYTSDPANASADYISVPSTNCLVTSDGKAESRRGYTKEFRIGVADRSAKPFYHQTYDIVLFALGTKVFYRDFTTNETFDTGITLTDGTVTRCEEIFGDILLSNTTDGCYVIRFMRLNDPAATAGDSTVTIDVDGAARISVYGDIAAGADDLRIRGVNEEMASLVISTGVVTLGGTLSQSYNNNEIAIVVRQYSSLEKFSKSVLWKSRLHGMGFPSAVNADQPNNTVMAGQFVIGQTGAAGIELVLDFSYGTGGSTKIVVGGGGKVTNILGVKEFLYFFTERKTSATSSADITTSGSAIGLTIPDEKDSLHGCLNEDCATVMGDSAVTWADVRKFMRLPISTDTGAPVSPAEEAFDAPIKDHLVNMDADQVGALVYHYRGGRQTIYQVKISGQWTWFIYDHNIGPFTPSGDRYGAWQPPQLINPVTGFFERDGVLYGTDMNNDTVYSFFTSFTDNQTAIQSTIATGEFDVGNAMMQTAALQGDINQPAEINIRCYVTNNMAGRRSGSAKLVSGGNYSYSADLSIGAVPYGSGGVETVSTQIAKWKKEFGIFPSQANTAQLIAENFQNGGYFSISSFLLTGQQYAGTFASAL